MTAPLVTSCCYAPPVPGTDGSQCGACWGPVRPPHRLLDPLVELDRAIEKARALRFPRGEARGWAMEREPHVEALQVLSGACCLLAGAGGPEVARRMTAACSRAIAVVVAPSVVGSLDALVEAGELLDVALRAELARLRREAA